MIVYSVNCGHCPSFKEASELRKKRLGGNGLIFAAGSCYTVKVHTTIKKADSEKVRDKLPESLDVWIEERDTSLLKEVKDGGEK